TAWAKPDRAKAYELILGSIAEHGEAVSLPAGPGFFQFSDEQAARATLEQAGFTGIAVEEVAQTWRLPDEQALFETYLNGTVRVAATLRAQSPRALQCIRDAVIAK